MTGPRVVVDPGVYVSALITPAGAPGQLLAAILAGRLRAIVCPHLLEEVAGVLAREKFRAYVSPAESAGFVELIATVAEHHENPQGVSAVCRDPDDDYLLALVERAQADAVISGDRDLLALAPERPVRSPRQCLDELPA